MCGRVLVCESVQKRVGVSVIEREIACGCVREKESVCWCGCGWVGVRESV